MDNQKLDFIKPITDNTNYREEQEELITKAIEITDNKLDALNYIATAILHETGKPAEFILVINLFLSGISLFSDMSKSFKI